MSDQSTKDTTSIIEKDDDKPPCFYELLAVEKTATQDQIRKAYLKASLKWHPDKNPGDEAAEEMFKMISEAYAVLSDEAKRDLYDKYGHSAVKDNIDPEELFEQMFGTRDPAEAFKKCMADPDLRGPVISGIGLATTVGSVFAIYDGIKNKKGALKTAGHIGGGLLGTGAGLLVTVGGLATWGVDKGIQATKKGIDNLKEKRENRKSGGGSGDNSPTSSNNKDKDQNKQEEKSKRPSQFGENFTKLFKSYTSPNNTENKPTNQTGSSSTGPIPMPMPGNNTSNSTTTSQSGPIPMPMPGSQQNMPPPFGSASNQSSSQVNDGGGIYPNLN